MKIGFFGTRFDDKEMLTSKLQIAGVDAETFFSEEVLDIEHMPNDKDFEIICVFMDSAITKEVIDSLPNLKYIAVRATGYDNVDLEAARERGISVSNVPSYGENTVAEFAFGLILNLSRKIYECIDQVKETGSFSVENLVGFDLAGKTLGVVGTGRIGSHVIKIAKGFEMNVLGFDMYPNEKLSSELGFQYLPLEELLAQSDIISLHVPYTKETHHLIAEKEFSQMKNGAYLINTSRGAVVDTGALVASIQSGHLGGAALDVLEEEGVMKDEMEFIRFGHPGEHDMKIILADHVLIDMPNVLITPHNAFNSKEAFQRIMDTTVSNIKSFIGGSPTNLVK